MALCKIGKTVSALKDPKEWRTIRDLLKESKLHQLTGRNEDLFRCLQESYDNMTDDMKERFLLCSIWPENENIPTKKLIRWWTGLGMLDRFPNNASDSGCTLINVLVRASMLEKGDNGLDSTEHSHVKMHSMIRKMAIGIVNEHGKNNKWLPNSLYRSVLREELWCTVEKAWVSEEDTSRWSQWSPKARFPELKMLVAQHLFSLQLIQVFQNITFLDLEGVTLFSPEKGKTAASQSIHAHSQFDAWEIICELTELQHLNLSATALDFLPQLLQKLSKLEYLYIRNNMHLRTIPRQLILALKRLRGLDLFHTGGCYEVLQELASFTIDLNMLGFTVRTVGEIRELGQLETVCTQALCMHHVQDKSDPEIINLKFLSKLRELRELAIVQSFDSQKVLEAEGGPESDYYQQLMPHLEIFELNNLLSLEKVIWKNAGLSIRVVSICDCDNLKDVTWVHHLKYLEQLTVSQCQGMERLIAVGKSSQDVAMNQTATISFPRLQKLTLAELPKLSMISQQACRFEDLSCFIVTRCNEMKDIHDQDYKQLIKIHCSEDWWTGSKSAGKSNPYLRPIFF
jgi:disease resistance protein RPS2